MCRRVPRSIALLGSALRRGQPMFGSSTLRCSRALLSRSTLFRRCSGSRGCTMRSGSALLGSRTVFGCGPLCRGCTGACSCALRCCGALRGHGAIGPAMSDLQRAAQEALFCQTILAKSGDNVLLETLRGAAPVTWAHYPPGDVFDPESGAQWYYHCHDASPHAAEHGHFHCFIRPQGKTGPIHHLVGVGVDAYGRLVRLFTVNHWVVGDDWADAATTTPLLERFDVHMARPSYLVNRWLTAVLSLYQAEIAQLIAQRDACLDQHQPPEGIATREDRSLEVTSELMVDLAARAKALGV